MAVDGCRSKIGLERKNTNSLFWIGSYFFVNSRKSVTRTTLVLRGLGIFDCVIVPRTAASRVMSA